MVNAKETARRKIVSKMEKVERRRRRGRGRERLELVAERNARGQEGRKEGRAGGKGRL